MHQVRINEVNGKQEKYPHRTSRKILPLCHTHVQVTSNNKQSPLPISVLFTMPDHRHIFNVLPPSWNTEMNKKISCAKIRVLYTCLFPQHRAFWRDRKYNDLKRAEMWHWRRAWLLLTPKISRSITRAAESNLVKSRRHVLIITMQMQPN